MIESIVVSCEDEGFCKMTEEVAGAYGITVLALESPAIEEGAESGFEVDLRGDGFLFFTEDRDTVNSEALRTRVREKGKLWLSLPPDEDVVHILAGRARDWIYENGLVSLQISGDVLPAHVPVCRDILKALFAMCLLRTRPEDLHEALKEPFLTLEKNLYPDIISVIRDLETRLPLKDKVALARFEDGIPMLVDSVLAVYILGHYLWPPNPELLADCALKEGILPDQIEENTALSVLLEAFLGELRKTYLLRVIPGGGERP